MPASSRRAALIAGATGLVGRACLQHLLAEPAVDEVIALVRRAPDWSHPKLRVEVVDFARPDRMRPVAATDAFCALGTTIAAAGSQEAFRAVDFLAVLGVADLAVQGGARQFVLVSSVGADPTSGNFYLSVKGEAEAAVAKRPFRGVSCLRPGLLLGAREESRPAEAIFRGLAPFFNPLLVGSLRRYRSVAADAVGRAMVAAALEDREEHRVLYHDDILRLAG